MKLCECNQCGLEGKPGRRFIYGHSKRGKSGFWKGKKMGPRKPKSEPKLCECGVCGQYAKSGRRFIQGHNGRNKKQSEELKKIKSEKLKGRLPWNTGLTKETSEGLRRRSENISGENSFWYGKTNSKHPMFGRKNPHTAEWNKKISEKNKGKRHTVEQKERNSKELIKKWKDPDYVSKQMKSRGVRPNKLELKFEQFLNELQFGEWKYVGDGQLIIAGKCPDFVNINGKKQIIELFGDYWHKGQSPKDRIKVFEPFGYKTLVIWEKELRNKNSLVKKVKEFSNG